MTFPSACPRCGGALRDSGHPTHLQCAACERLWPPTAEMLREVAAQRDAASRESEGRRRSLVVVAEERTREWTRAEVAEARVQALEAALKDAIQHAEEGWSYASLYFQEKWDHKGEVSRLRAVLEIPAAVPVQVTRNSPQTPRR